MGRTADCCRSCLHCAFHYETSKTLVISNIWVGCVFRFIQLLILSYVVGYVCMVQKSYQENDSVVGTVTTKVKGFAFTNTSYMDPRFWDVADYVIPPQGTDSFFVVTNIIITPNQTQSRCPELPRRSTTCANDSDCIKGHSNPRGSGVQTGQCVNYSTNVKTCEVFSWCPLEKDSFLPHPALLAEAENFTVLIKSSITYPKFGLHRKNILPHINSSYLQSCEYNRETDPECPIFRLGYIVSEAGEDFQDIAVKGGAIGILIDWSCNLDGWGGKNCKPKFNFQRLDNKDPANDVATGLNFRFAKYFQTPDGKETRILIKAYGIRFDVIVFGTAGKFGIVPTIMNLGAALAFLSLVPAVTDWVMLTCMRRRDLYARHKVSYLSEDVEAESVLPMGHTYGTQE